MVIDKLKAKIIYKDFMSSYLVFGMNLYNYKYIFKLYYN